MSKPYEYNLYFRTDKELEIKEKIQAEAKEENRSMNGQILYILGKYFKNKTKKG